MSIVVIGGHDRMCRQYEEEGKKYGCKVKVFTQHTSQFEKEIGRPHYIVVFTDVVSHKMVKAALNVSKKKGIPNLRLHNGSLNSIKTALEMITGRRTDFVQNKS